MIYGLYLSGQGAQVQSLRQDVVANNLANASTNAFKRDLVRLQAHAPYDVERNSMPRLPGNLQDLPGGVSPFDVVTEFAPGQLQATSNPFDIALSGKGFFRVSDGKRDYLTRDGQFSLTSDGRLVTREHGHAVFNTAGTAVIGLDPAIPVQISNDGSITQQGDEFGKLALVEPSEYKDLEKTGNNLYAGAGRLKPLDEGTEVKQGYLEGSSASPVTEMMQLIEASRAFEANVNMIKYQDDALGRLLQSMPRK